MEIMLMMVAHLEEDVCGVCNGGINDVSSCVDCPESDPADCFGVCGGSAVNDECGVCGGDNSTCSDCAGIPNGTSIINECGTCVDATCVQGCEEIMLMERI